MRIAFIASDKPRERQLARAVLAGARRHGHAVAAFRRGEEPEPGRFDVVAMVGVKSRELFETYRAAGTHVLYLDKGYCRWHKADSRGWEYWRIAIDAHHPTAALSGLKCSGDRWDALGLAIKPWRRRGEEIVIAGSSAKYHEFYGLPEPTEYAASLVRELGKRTDRPIAYRPKPSWKDAVPIARTRFSKAESLLAVLDGAWAVVTHGSNACFEAVLAGVPCIVLGDAVAKPLSSTSLNDIESPLLATESQRKRWARNLAWFQWTLPEFRSGAAWEFIGGQLA